MVKKNIISLAVAASCLTLLSLLDPVHCVCNEFTMKQYRDKQCTEELRTIEPMPINGCTGLTAEQQNVAKNSYSIDSLSVTTQCDMTAMMQMYYSYSNCTVAQREIVSVWGRCNGPMTNSEGTESYYYILTSAKALLASILAFATYFTF